MSQDVRNKVYTVIAGVLGILLVLGIINEAQSEVVVDLANRVLDILPIILGLISSALAAYKSRPSAVAVIDQPRAQVTEVALTDGTVVAGPANALPDNTVLN